MRQSRYRSKYITSYLPPPGFLYQGNVDGLGGYVVDKVVHGEVGSVGVSAGEEGGEGSEISGAHH